jgi:deoxyribonuclease IV
MSPDAFVGAQVASDRPLQHARALGADCLQLYLSDPSTFGPPPVRHDEEDLRTSQVPTYVHAPYDLNVCSAVSELRRDSRAILQATCDAASRIRAAGLVTHGGHAEDDFAAGVGRWIRTVETLRSEVPLLIENAAGGEGAVTRRIDDLAQLWDAVSQVGSPIRVGICIDTCHAHAAGEDLSDVIERVLAFAGRIDLLHANDSRDPWGSGRDRHVSLGEGKIDPELLRHMIRAAGSPVVCENTHPASAEALRADMAFVRETLRAAG